MQNLPADIPDEVAAKFEALALEIAKAGFTRYSARAILHRIRWHFHIERAEPGFKCNDHWTPPLARWFLARHAELPAFFETRQSQNEAA